MRAPRFGLLGRSGRFAGLLLALAGTLAIVSARRPNDPLAAEIARWSEYVEKNPSKDEVWLQVKGACSPLLAGARDALRDGRRYLALQRLAAAYPNLAGSVYSEKRAPGPAKDLASFETEWARMGEVLRSDIAPPAGSSFDGVAPAAVRAMGEAALPQTRAFYESALVYARSTSPEFGLFYIGAAEAQRDFVRFCRTLSAATSSPRPAPPVRPLAGELDALEAKLLSAYRPPVSIDRHPEFIGASSTLKEARELDAKGLRYGALLRYLVSVQRTAALASPVTAPALDRSELTRRLDAFETRLSAEDVDHSVGRLFLEGARADVESPSGNLVIATAAATEVLPQYFAALLPARPSVPPPPPQATVTLIRWPYT